MTGRTQTGRFHHSRPRDCRAVRVFHPAFRLLRRQPAWCRRARRDRCRKSHWKCIVISRGRTPPILRIVRLFTRCSREGEADPLARSGVTANGRPGRRRQLRARRPAIRAGHNAHSGYSPAASTEVVLAEGYDSALPLVVRWGFPFSPAGRRWPEGSDEGAAGYSCHLRFAHSRLRRSPPQPPAGTFSPLGRRGVWRRLALSQRVVRA